MKITLLKAAAIFVAASVLNIFSINMAWAATDPYRLFPTVSCPAIGDEYDVMINKLEALKASIKSSANCQEVSDQVKTLEQLLNTDRKTVIDIATKPRQEPLSTQEALTVQSYAENVTLKASSLYDLFSRSNQCFEDDSKQSQLSALSGIISEASGLIGKVAGPWGTPIVLSGSVVAGFLSGLDNVLQSQKGYKFEDREQWKDYVQNLCTYYEYKEQIYQLLNPADHLERLKNLREEAVKQVNLLSSICSECRLIRAAFDSQAPGNEDSVGLNSQARIADFGKSQPLVTYTLQGLGITRWVDQELARAQAESQSNWGNVSGRHLLSQIKNDIEQFLFVKEAPNFLNYQVNKSHSDFDDFKRLLRDEGDPLYAEIDSAQPGFISRPYTAWYVYGGLKDLDIFDMLILSPLNWSLIEDSPQNDELRYAWVNFHDTSIAKFQTARDSLSVFENFCSFFKYSGYYLRDIRSKCTQSDVAKLIGDEDQIVNGLEKTNIFLNSTQNTHVNESENSAPARDHIEALTLTIELRNKN